MHTRLIQILTFSAFLLLPLTFAVPNLYESTQSSSTADQCAAGLFNEFTRPLAAIADLQFLTQAVTLLYSEAPERLMEYKEPMVELLDATLAATAELATSASTHNTAQIIPIGIVLNELDQSIFNLRKSVSSEEMYEAIKDLPAVVSALAENTKDLETQVKEACTTPSSGSTSSTFFTSLKKPKPTIINDMLPGLQVCNGPNDRSILIYGLKPPHWYRPKPPEQPQQVNPCTCWLYNWAGSNFAEHEGWIHCPEREQRCQLPKPSSTNTYKMCEAAERDPAEVTVYQCDMEGIDGECKPKSVAEKTRNPCPYTESEAVCNKEASREFKLHNLKEPMECSRCQELERVRDERGNYVLDDNGNFTFQWVKSKYDCYGNYEKKEFQVKGVCRLRTKSYTIDAVEAKVGWQLDTENCTPTEEPYEVEELGETQCLGTCGMVYQIPLPDPHDPEKCRSIPLDTQCYEKNHKENGSPPIQGLLPQLQDILPSPLGATTQSSNSSAGEVTTESETFFVTTIDPYFSAGSSNSFSTEFSSYSSNSSSSTSSRYSPGSNAFSSSGSS